jgi:hypothetical protein
MEEKVHLHVTAALPLGNDLPLHINLTVGWTPEPVQTIGISRHRDFLLYRGRTTTRPSSSLHPTHCHNCCIPGSPERKLCTYDASWAICVPLCTVVTQEENTRIKSSGILFCRKEAATAQHIICGCEALAGQRYNVFGYPSVEATDISTASVRNLCLFIRGRGLLNVLNAMFRVSTISLWLRCIRSKFADGLYRRQRE